MFAVLLVLATETLSAQQLKIDDVIPDNSYLNILNWKADSLQLSDFKKKLIILDFWSFSCIACLEAFPKIDSIQREFNKDIQFIAVNNESLESTKKFKDTHPRIYFPDIPYITGDSLLSAYFPRVYVPWNVWIDSSLKVHYITDGYNATRNHISSFINEQYPALNQLKFDSAYFRQNSLLGNSQLAEAIVNYSYLARCIPEWSIGNHYGNEEKNSFRLSQNCSSIIHLLQTAFGEHGKYDFSFPTTWQLDESLLKDLYEIPTEPDKLDSWKKNYCFSYDLVVPASKANEVFRIMQRDLINYFQIKAEIKKKEIECYSLKRIEKTKTIGRGKRSLTNSNNYNYHQESISEIVSSFNNLLLNSHCQTYVIDETGYREKASVSIHQALFDKVIDIDKINLQLKEYNLKLVKKKIIREVLFVSK